MTSYPDRSPYQPAGQPTAGHHPAATRDDSPQVAGLVPITVWRLDDHDDGQPATQPGSTFASRLARRLILTYTGHGESVVDLDHDRHLHDAAIATGRCYLTITEPARPPGPDQLTERAGLVTLQWPRPTSPSTVQAVGALLTACRPIMNDDASVIAAVPPSDPAQPGATFADHEHALRGIAEAAGLTHILQIVAVSAAGEGDQFLYYATDSDLAQVLTNAGHTPDRQVLHIDLLVFCRQGGSS
jgi:hypothetical protein